MKEQLIFDKEFKQLLPEREYYKDKLDEFILVKHKNFIDDIRIKLKAQYFKYYFKYYFNTLIFDYYNNETIFYLVKVYVEDIFVVKYLIVDDGIIDSRSNTKYSFDEEYKENLLCIDPEYLENKSRIQRNKTINEIFFDTFIDYIDFESLSELKQSKYYKYSNYDEAFNDIFENHHSGERQLRDFVLTPVYYKSYEFLTKMRLFNLAKNSSFLFDYDKSLRNIFKISKEKLKLIINLDMNFSNLMTFKLLDYDINLYYDSNYSGYAPKEKFHHYFFYDNSNEIPTHDSNSNIYRLRESEACFYYLLCSKLKKDINKYII